MNRFLDRLFDFLASLRLAVVVLVTLLVVLTVAMVYESEHGTPAVRRAVYSAPWFDGLLALLGVNVAAAALKRYPWRRDQIPFVVTHAGIITILIGSFVTRHWGVDGTLALAEGEEGAVIRTQSKRLAVAVPSLGVQRMIPVDRLMGQTFEGQTAFRASIEETPLVVTVESAWRHTRLVTFYAEDGPGPNPAVRVRLEGSMAQVEEWLLPHDPERRTLDLGPMTLSAKAAADDAEVRAFLESDEGAPEMDLGHLVLGLPGRETPVHVEVGSNLGKAVPLEDTGLVVKLLEQMSRAIVEDRYLVDREDAPPNPALLFEISGPEGTESHVAFARFPDFSTLRGHGEGWSGIKAVYHASADHGSPPRGNEVAVLLGPGSDAMHVRIISRGELAEAGPLAVGEAWDLPWMGFTFTVVERIERAQAHQELTQAEVPQDEENAMPALQVRVAANGASETGWVRWASQRRFNIEPGPAWVAFRSEAIPMGFSLRLVDFEKGLYPGTRRAATYSSKVILRDPVAGIDEERLISMNNPLKHGGFTLYQSSFVEGTPEISVFSAGRDPGLATVYTGCILLVGGVAAMFYVRPRLRRHARRVRKSAKPVSTAAS